jgi:hypothetical protein
VFTARYGLSPYIKQIRFVFKGLMDQDTEPSEKSDREGDGTEPEEFSNDRHRTVYLNERTNTRRDKGR